MTAQSFPYVVRWARRFAQLALAWGVLCAAGCDEPSAPLSGGAESPTGDQPRAHYISLSPDAGARLVSKVKVLTLLSPSVIAWGEVEVYGAPPESPERVSNLARGSLVSASSHLATQPPPLAADGQERSMWNAGTHEESWIEFDLGAPCALTEVRLFVAQDVPGLTSHVLMLADEHGNFRPAHQFLGDTTHGQWLSYTPSGSEGIGGVSGSGGMLGGDELGGDEPITGGEAGSSGGHSAGGGEAGAPLGGEEPVGGEAPPPVGPTVGKWRRLILSFEHERFEGQPFLLEMSATFTHQSSGQSLSLPAYYDGESTWRVAFMPTQLGVWRWRTSSEEAALDGHEGQVTAVDSGHQGLLTADPSAPNKWRFLDGPPVVPTGLFVNGMLDDASAQDFERLADFLEEHEVTLINFRLSEHDLAFSSVADLSLDLELWRRLERRVELLTERGVGVDLMLYTDDSGRPSFGAQSPAERLLIRYMIARLASFPSVLFNTGIDLIEYRDQAWVDWFGSFVRSLDPYGHPVSSRYGGGSGNLMMREQTFNSVGARNSTMSELVNAYNRADQIPALNNDNWSEDLEGLNGHSPADIRRAVWKAILAGGVGFSVRHNTLYCPRGITECDRYFPIDQAIGLFDSGPWFQVAQRFLREQLGEAYQQMHPRPELVAAGGGKYALADDEGGQLLFLLMGRGDTWDSGDGGPVTLQLEGLSGDFTASWLDPRTGELSSAGSVSGGQAHQLPPPSEADWVLWLRRP